MVCYFLFHLSSYADLQIMNNVTEGSEDYVLTNQILQPIAKEIQARENCAYKEKTYAIVALSPPSKKKMQAAAF